MRTLLITLLIISWILFIISFLLMSPKWWLWVAVWWSAWSNEYWSKKSIENTLKKLAIITCIIFLWFVLVLPYIK